LLAVEVPIADQRYETFSPPTTGPGAHGVAHRAAARAGSQTRKSADNNTPLAIQDIRLMVRMCILNPALVKGLRQPQRALKVHEF
jgi:hypothetical protein